MHKREDAQKLNSELLLINDSLNHYGKVWGDEFKVAVNTKDFTHLSELREDISTYLNQKSVFVRSMKDVGGSEAFRQSVLDILQFEKDVILPKMAAFESFDSATTDENIKAAFSDMMATTRDDLIKHDTMFRRMNAYAEKNDFPKPVDK